MSNFQTGSNWLAYYNTNHGIYTLNLLQAQREQERLNFEKVASAASWSPIGAQIAFVKIDTSQLIVLDPNEGNLAEYDLPEGLKTLGIFELQWDLSGEKLFILAGEKQPLSKNIELWSFSLSQNEWTRSGEFVTNNLGYKLTMDGNVVFCGGAGDQTEIYLQNVNEKQSLYNGLGKFACESLSIARDGEGLQHLFILETDDGWKLYSTVISKNGFAENLEQIDFRIPVLQPMLFYPYQLSAVFVGSRK